ncbi:amidase [Actinoallomurus iriomotensis]|uniref:Amidase n=1 Tax=Actinoallomurus iriomotensis TaxID=478107 RepID=A0A9W6RYC3_9ACTN|nr:amidase [Actinoallomurus iriomotensis]GLY85016.1 amidase [Actinoallomurus iriomotensis]
MAEEIHFLSARELARRVRDRELSAREVTEAHLARIEAVNPRVNAIVTLTADRALREADEADALLASGTEPPPLLGLPVAHKDTHETAGVLTTSGSPLLADNVPELDELVIERMRAAGTVMLGKTNVPEFAAGSHTFNPLFGTTRNPYDLARSAGGSSGGAAAALAAGLHPLADGSDMGGSLRNPASFCNVVGLRPSPGRVPSWPDAGAWATMGVQGPMARDVADVALLLSVLAGPDPRSPIALETPGSAFAVPLERDLTGLRVAWAPRLDGSMPFAPEVISALEGTAKVFTELGCVVEEACPDLSGADEVFRVLRAWKFELALGTVMDRHRDQLKPSVVANIEEGRRLTGPEVGRAEVLHTRLHHNVRRFFESYDVLLAPVSQVPPFDADLEYPTEIAGEPMTSYVDWMRSAYLISATGCPALSVPGGFTDDGLPIGLQVIGPHRADLLVLQAGHAFEQATHHGERRPPL